LVLVQLNSLVRRLRIVVQSVLVPPQELESAYIMSKLKSLLAQVVGERVRRIKSWIQEASAPHESTLVNQLIMH
jgi:hypothetical protein